MSTEVLARSLEDLELSRRVMIEYAAGRLALSEVGMNGNMRPYQVSAYNNGLRYIVDSQIEGSPQVLGRFEETTGWGKSPAQAEFASSVGFGQRRGGRLVLPESAFGLTMVPTQFLRDQLYEDYARFAPNIPVGVRGMGTTKYNDDGQMLIATYSYAINALRRGEFRPGQFGWLSSDESHRTLGTMTQLATRALQRYAFHFGWSATPGYTPERSIAHTLPHLIDRTSVLDGILAPEKEMRFLSGVRLFTKHTGEAVREYSRSQDFTTHEVEHLAQSSARNTMILGTALHALANTKGKGLIKCIPGNGRGHAYAMAAMLREQDFPGTHRKIRAIAIDGSNKDSSDFIRRFANTDEYDVVTYVDMLGEGVNIKDLKWGIWGAPTKSLLKLTQFMGRGLRPKSDGSPFFMYQLLDDARRSPESLAYAWEILEMAKEPPQGFLVAPYADTSNGFELPELIGRSGNHVRQQYEIEQPDVTHQDIAITKPVLSLSTEPIPPDNFEQTHRSLDYLADKAGVEEKWLKRILALNGFAALQTANAREYVTLYDAEAEAYLENNLAKTGDLPQAEAAAYLGLTLAGLRGRATSSGEEFEPVYLHPRNPVPGKDQVLHFTEAQILALDKRPKKVVAGGALDVPQIAKLMNAASYNVAKTLLIGRGFVSVTVPSTKKTGPREIVAYSKDEVTSWASAYAVAEEAAWPVKGYADFRETICKEYNISLREAWIIAQDISANVRIFKTGRGGGVREHVQDQDYARLRAAAKQYSDKMKKSSFIMPNKSEIILSRSIQRELGGGVVAAAEYSSVAQVPIQKLLPPRNERARDLFYRPYLSEVTPRTHISAERICKELEVYGISSSVDNIRLLAVRHGVRNIDSAQESFFKTADADDIISLVVEQQTLPEDGAPSLSLHEVASKLRCSTGVIRTLVNLHPALAEAHITSGKNEEPLFSAKYLESLHQIISAAVPNLHSRALFVTAFRKDSPAAGQIDSTNPKQHFPKEFWQQIITGKIPLGDNGNLYLVYGGHQVKQFAIKQRSKQGQKAS
jgi:superfamily II DNA or RNA helicase